MKAYGVDWLETAADPERFPFKLIANERGVAFFPRTTEHRDVKYPGLSYEDDFQGNALAAMVMPGVVEFRYHAAFSDSRVRHVAHAIIKHPRVMFAAQFAVTYQGRSIM
ncbi:MAG: hypothetical protein KDA42_16495 [Planctomycetales bacterium]|nr:hypothetical protein [Planctomycetales bacterium]